MMAGSGFDKLSLEILLLIFNLIESTAPESLPHLRLSSRSLNQLAKPIVYCKVTLGSDILGPSSNAFIKNISKMIYSHVREVVIDHETDWDLAAQFLTKCCRLQTLTWKIKAFRLESFFPERLSLLFEERPNLGLNLTCYSYGTDWVRAPEQIRSYPAGNLVSFNVSYWGRKSSAEPLQEFLAASRRLQTLVLGEDMRTFDPERGRLPPVRSLNLPTWHHTKENTKKIWDFTLLQDLEIPWSKFIPFLKAVPPEDLGQLKRFRVDDSCWEWPSVEVVQRRIKSDSEALVGLLSTLLRSRHDFQELDIRCPLKLFDMSLIAGQGQSLQFLTLLDVAGFEMEGIFPTVSLSDLLMIQQSCTHITKLHIGVNIVGSETSNFLDIISSFRRLDDLTIYTQSKLLVETVDDIIEDVDRKTATDIKDALLSIKCGVAFSKLTVNVGGWRENGPHHRRWGLNWDRRRDKGLNPERLFILDRGHEANFRFREYRPYYQKPWPGSE